MSAETFGMQLHRLRRSRGLTQVELADLVGCRSYSISKWESDLARPQARFRPKLAQALGVTLTYMRIGAEAVVGPPPPIVRGRRWEKQPAADVALFCQMWRRGTLTRRMAKELGVDLCTVHKVRKRLGLPPRRPDIARNGGYAS